MNEYTPSVEQARREWVGRNMGDAAMFDRFVAEVARAAKAEALEEAATEIDTYEIEVVSGEWLRARAAEYRKVATDE